LTPRIPGYPVNDSESRVTEPSPNRADVTRQQILMAAAQQFAHRPYSQVSLDDILADAEVTKGAMYFHFRSKYALAIAIIDEAADNGRRAVNEVLARRLSGLETAVDLSYLIGVQDIRDELARAALNLLEGIGRAGGVQTKLLGQWIDSFAVVLRRAVEEGDVRDHADPEAAGRLLVALYMGLRQISDLADAHAFFTDLEQTWLLVLPGLAAADRVDYMTQFIKRRSALAIHTAPLRPRRGESDTDGAGAPLLG
jgi:TetR/AcrR family transcriptional regulator, transcriptional repressor for nem operon